MSYKLFQKMQTTFSLNQISKRFSHYPYMRPVAKHKYIYYEEESEKPLTKIELKEIEHIYDVVGLTKTRNHHMFVPSLIVFDPLLLSANEYYHVFGLIKAAGYYPTNVRAYLSKKFMASYPQYSEILSLISDGRILIVNYDRKHDFTQMVKNCLKILSTLPPNPLLSKNLIPFNKRLILAGGRFNDTVFTANELIEITKLPPKPELVGQLSYSLDQPVTALSRNLTHHLDKLSSNIKQIIDQKTGDN